MYFFAGYVKTVKDEATGELKEVPIGDQGNLDFTKFCQRLGWKKVKT